MKKRLMIILIAVTVLVSTMPVTASACTAAYVGKKASQDGTIIIARSNDAHPMFNPIKLDRREAKDTAGQEYKQVTNNFTWKYPDKTYSYVCAPQWECNTNDEGRFAGYAMNEMGVTLTATTTGYACEKALAADPYAKNGIKEEGIPDIVGPCCKTAREVVELLAKICDKQGSGESNIVMINDKDEAWYMEMYTGHQYAAVKMPEDAVSVYGNEFMLENLEDYDEVITSPNLKSLPEKSGFAEYDADGRFDVFDTYAGKGRLADYANRRTWYGHYVFSPSTAGEYNTTTKYPLFFKPDAKIALTDVMNLLRSRFEGTEFDPSINDSKELRVIGTETQEMVHVLQTYSDLPANRCSIAWTSIAPSECGVYLPQFSCMDSFDPAFTKDNAEYVIDDEAAYSVFKELNTLSTTNRKLYKPAVAEYWGSLEKHLTKTVSEAMSVSKDMSDRAAQKYLTAYGKKVEKAAFEDAKILSDDVLLAMVNNNDTLKSKFDYKTLTYVKEVEPEPAKISLNTKDFATKYAIDEPETANIGLIIGIATVVIVLAIVVIKRNKKIKE